MSRELIRYLSLPLTEPPPDFIGAVVDAFNAEYHEISTIDLEKGLKGDRVLEIIRKNLEKLGFKVERGKRKKDKIFRPVFFGEDGIPMVRYEVDAYHPEWRCGLEVEAGRAWMGNAIYRDLIQGLLMVQLEYLIIAVPNAYKYKTSGRHIISKDFEHANELARALYSHTRFTLPYRLILIGY